MHCKDCRHYDHRIGVCMLSGDAENEYSSACEEADIVNNGEDNEQE